MHASNVIITIALLKLLRPEGRTRNLHIFPTTTAGHYFFLYTVEYLSWGKKCASLQRLMMYIFINHTCGIGYKSEINERH